METYRLWIEKQMEANNKYAAQASRLPQVDTLDEDQLEEQLRYWDRRLDREYDREYPSSSVIRRCRNMIREIKAKLASIQRFVAATNSTYEESNHVLSILSRAEGQLKGVSYNQQERTIQFGEVSHAWLLELNAIRDNMPKVIIDQEINDAELMMEEYVALLLGENGRSEALRILSKDEITDKEYQALAVALLATEDKDMLGMVLNQCYEYKAVFGPLQEGAGISTVNVVYEKSKKLEKIQQQLLNVSNKLMKEYRNAIPADRTVLKGMFLNAMQYEHLCRELQEMGDELTVSTQTSLYGDKSQTKPEGGDLISVQYDSQGNLIVQWCNYAGNGHLTQPYSSQKEFQVEISKPTVGTGVWNKVQAEGFGYIKSSLDLGFGMDNIEGMAADTVWNVVGESGSDVLGKVSVVGTVWDYIQGIVKPFQEEAEFKKGEAIAALGSPAALFNLYCTSTVVEVEGKENKREYVMYPSYTTDDSPQLSTEDCIENFNKNFGSGGRFENAGEKLEIDIPLTQELLLDEMGLKAILEKLNRWHDYADKEEINPGDAVVELQ